ncbi:MAG: pilus assembly protein N-terminal domain-containing protein [Anaerolineae bacterium]|nr:pilus assembly protein N-terminal domain-containing protein [Anaerolineae bacterium]
MFKRRSKLAQLGLVLLILAVIGTGCSLSGGDGGGQKAETQPTAPPTITPPMTRTAFPTFTPFPTLTPGGAIFTGPTATRIVLAPTFTPYPTPFFTWVPQVTAYPYDVRISYPVSGSQVAGYITIIGSASHPRFLQYALEWGPDPNPSNLWYPLMSPRNQTVINGGLGAWNTTNVNDGVYQIRLHVWLNDGTETFAVATGVRVSNRQPTAVPTLTPTPKPNRLPILDPIASQEVNAGASRDISVKASDPDGDTVNLFVASSNVAIATVQVTSPTQIRVTGVTAGTATITVTANDNRGGLTSTAFIVTVKGLNQAPAISPILEQKVDVGASKDVPVSVSDPDGDTLTVQAESDNVGVALATVLNTSTLRLTGVGVGTANITVTASDGKGGEIKTAFLVRVGKPNLPPIVGTIPAQTLAVGGTLDVPYLASDPDGDAMTQTASSDTPGVVTASVTAPGIIRLAGVSAGTATVTLTLNDGINAPTLTTFAVTVVAGNAAPTISPLGPQTMGAGETRDVPYVATDPDGDALSASVFSDNTNVVTAALGQPSLIRLSAVGAGTATVTLTVDDGKNPPVSASFTVSVAAANLPPAVETIFPQTLGAGDSLDVPYTAVDPEGDTLTATVSVDNPTVATAAIYAPGTISLTGVSAGSATVTLSVTDGTHPAVTMPFTATVVANAPPSVAPLGTQVLGPGEARDVPYTASDPEGDPLTATASSDNPGVVAAAVNVPGLITLNAVGAGAATVTLSVSDGVNAPVTTSFAVTVSQPNMPPSVAPLGTQVLGPGEARDVPYTASDPEGDPLTATASSDNPGVVAAAVNVPGVITLNAVGAGAATVTLSVSDGVNAPVTTSFAVTVSQPNANPVIQPVPDQTVSVGASLSVPVSASDPDGDTVTLTAVSDNPGVATAFAGGPGEVILGGVTPGTATILVDASDGRGGFASVSFLVTVQGVNNAPVIQPIPDQSLSVGETIAVSVSISDPDGDPLVAYAVVQNTGVVFSEMPGTDTITLQGLAEGVTAVDVYADDNKGGLTTATFTVTVSSAPPSFDLMAYPVVPQIPDSMAVFLSQLYGSAVINFGTQAGVFAKVGDDAMDSPNFMAPFAVSGYDLGSFGNLQATIDFYAATPVRPALDPTINSFNVDSVAAGDGWGIEDLSGPAPGGPPCDAVGGGTRLSCEYMIARPSIALISFSAPNVTYLPAEQFRSELQTLVSESMSNYGVIPVLATIPADGSHSTEALTEYNRAIVEVASESDVPLWNLWRAMQERGISDPFSVAPPGAGNLTDAALSYGYNMRNLTALQTLQAVRQAVGIN